VVENIRLNRKIIESHFFPQQTRDINNRIIPAASAVLAFKDFACEVWFYEDAPLNIERRMVSIGLVEEVGRSGYEVRLEIYSKISQVEFK
jgi:hypothetical protein